ncbi:hypothetical protein E4T26_006930 [Photobacterium damselae subsp. piscicida]|nr:hypothetical protein [Photobacterium damselae subsp. piscicida]
MKINMAATFPIFHCGRFVGDLIYFVNNIPENGLLESGKSIRMITMPNGSTCDIELTLCRFDQITNVGVVRPADPAYRLTFNDMVKPVFFETQCCKAVTTNEAIWTLNLKPDFIMPTHASSEFLSVGTRFIVGSLSMAILAIAYWGLM